MGEIAEKGVVVSIRGRVTNLVSRRARRRGLTILRGILDDGTGRLPVVWFNARGLEKRVRELENVVLFGTIREAQDGRLQLIHPEVEDAGSWTGRIVPVYPAVEGIGSSFFRRLIEAAFPALDDIIDPLPEALLEELKLPGLRHALRTLHQPPADTSPEALEKLHDRRSPADRRLAFDELLAFSLGLADLRRRRREQYGLRCPVTSAVQRRLESVVPFELTSAQRRVFGEIAGNLGTGIPMARLLQGDVGSGKTIVAALAMMVVLEHGYQVGLMAPTEVLALQHRVSLKELFRETPWEPVLLTGSVGARRRREILTGMEQGTTPCVVGTHAMIQETVRWRRLGLVVIDEQHRFGAAQRQALVDKGRSPHLLVMTATPIPRSLALTLYGDLDVSVIDEMPPGRRPVRTEIRDDAARARLYRFVREEVRRGGRVFVVYPLIEASDAIDARAVTDYAETVRRDLPGVRLGILHGRMDPAERDRVLDAFRTGEVEVLLATTVVEVGIDVPEASVMIIENAERFGLSQLHQLRGRIGRGGRNSWCVVMVGEGASDAARRRLKLFAETNDGFRLAEADLELRGSGDIGGVRQWGPSGFRFADLPRHLDLVETARTTARQLAENGEISLVKRALSRYHRTEFVIRAG